MTFLYLCEAQDDRSAPDSGPCRIGANTRENAAHCSDVRTAPVTRRDIEPPEGHCSARYSSAQSRAMNPGARVRAYGVSDFVIWVAASAQKLAVCVWSPNIHAPAARE